MVPAGLAAQPALRQIEWKLDAASGLIVGGHGAWQGQELRGPRGLGGRLGVLHIVGVQGEQLVVVVRLHTLGREPEVQEAAAIALPGSRWSPQGLRLLVTPVQGGWVVTGTLVGGGER